MNYVILINETVNKVFYGKIMGEKRMDYILLVL